MSLSYTKSKLNYSNNTFEQFYSQQNKNKEIANTNLPAGDTLNKGAPYADSTSPTVATPSPTPVTVSTAKQTSTASGSSTPLVGFAKNPQQSYSYVNTYTPSAKTTTTPKISSQTTPVVSSVVGNKTSKADGTVYSQPSIYNPYGQNGAFAKSAAAKASGVLDPITRKALEGIASWSDPDYVEYAKSLAVGNPEALKSIESDYNAAMLAAQELKYWNNLTKEKKLSLADLMALFNDADSYSKWLAKYGTDTEAARAEAYKNRQAEFDRNRSTYGRNAENLAQLGLTNSGYSDYLDGVGYAAYIAGLSDADSQKAMQDAEYARQYAQYLTEKEAAAKQQAMALYGSVMSGEITAEQAMEYAKFLGASDEDAQAVYNSASAIESTVTESNNNAELNSMKMSVLEMVQNGYGFDTAIKILYPDATEEQKKHIENYITDIENTFKEDAKETVLKNLKKDTTALSQQIAAGNADISGYVANYNSLLNNSDSDVVESGKAMLSESLKNDLLKLYEEGGLTKSQTTLKSYIEKYFGDENDETGLTTYNGKSDDEKDAFFQDVLDELYNDGNGVLNENDYNELKRPAFDAALENADSIQEIAEIAARLENGCYGTESAKNELEDILRNLLNVESVDGEFTYLWLTDNLLEKSTVVPVPEAAMGHSVSGEVSTTSGLKFAVWFNLEKTPPSEILNTATNKDGNQIVYYNGELYCVSTSQKYNKQYVFKATALNKSNLTAPEKNAITKIFPVKEVRTTFK